MQLGNHAPSRRMPSKRFRGVDQVGAKLGCTLAEVVRDVFRDGLQISRRALGPSNLVTAVPRHQLAPLAFRGSIEPLEHSFGRVEAPLCGVVLPQIHQL